MKSSSNQQQDPDDFSLSDIPIASEHAAGSLSLADVDYGLQQPLSPDRMEKALDSAAVAGCVVGARSPAELSPRNQFLAHRTKHHRSYFRSCVWGVAILLLIGTSTGLSLFVHKKNKSTSSLSTPSMQEVVEFLSIEHNISSYDVLNKPDTPQYAAAVWLTQPGAPPLPSASASTTNHPDNVLQDRYLYVARYILAVVYYSFQGDNWKHPLGFLNHEQSICQWHGLEDTKDVQDSAVLNQREQGVQCDEEGMPTVLDLEFNRLAGEIPAELGFLTSLRKLDLKHNLQLTGSIPTRLCQLSNLEYLSVAHNGHNGKLPECPWTQLQTLDLSDNAFSGNLPKDVCDRAQMVSLRAAGNRLRGSIPSCLAHWTNLEYLDISNNRMDGSLPSMLTQLTNLKEFILTHNKFTGNPTNIWNAMTQLHILHAQHNRLDGLLDENFCQNATDLIALDISKNNFTSHVLPTQLLNMPNLQVLNLALNNLKGHLPTDIERQNTLIFFSADQNNLDGGIPSQLQNLQGLQHLDLSHNSFHGPLREEILTNLPNLMNLLLGHNPNLHAATLPSQLVQMVELQELVLSDTQRQGPLPDLTGLTNLRILALDNNNMTSTIPTHYGTLPELQYLLLQNNLLLEGAVPDFSQATSLDTILLDNTNMNTQGWEELCQLPMFETVAELWSEVTLTSDCDAHCDCCHCCSDNETDYSNVTMDSLQWEWEMGARRQMPTLVDSKNV